MDIKDGELLKLLVSWDLGSVFSKLTDAGIGVKELEYLTEDDIQQIFPEFQQIGLKATFRGKLNLWKKNLTLTEKDTESVGEDVIPSVSNLSSTPTSAVSESSCLSSEIDVEQILSQTATGKCTLEFFSTNQNLTPVHQQNIANCIIDALTAKQKKLTTVDLKRISEKIVSYFPGENINTYYVPRYRKRNRPGGKLHDRYFNVRNKIRRTLGNFSQEKQKQQENIAEEDDLEVDTSVMHNLQCWLIYNDSPKEDVIYKWKQSVTFRRSYIITSNAPIEAILREWPLYKHADLGPKLVDIDFDHLHHGKSNMLLKNWTKFCDKIIPYFKKNIKEKESFDLLHHLNDEISDDSKHCVITLLLNAIIIPSTRITKESEDKISKKRKATIKEAKDSLILHIKDISDFEPAISDFRERFYQSKQTIQPLIIVVGKNIEHIKDFFVYFDGKKFKFPSFVSCLDNCFKIFQVFKLEYPKFCNGVWMFIQLNFYKFSNKTDKPFPQILGLISHLEKKSC